MITPNQAIMIFILGIILGAIFGMFGAIPAAHDNGYKQGQIDAMTGKRTYCLNQRIQWVEGNPFDNLECKKAD